MTSINTQEIFLAYRNRSFRENPENLQKFCELISTTYFNGQDPLHFKSIIKKISTLVKYNDPSAVKGFEQLIRDKFDEDAKRKASAWLIETPFRTAAEAVYGYREGFCEKRCFWREFRRKLFGAEKFKGTDRLKCYECEQMAFQNILDEIASGREYKAIIGFESGLRESQNLLKKSARIVRLKGHQVLEECWVPNVRSAAGFSSGKNKKTAFQQVLNSFIWDSLATYLLTNDREKLKKCPHCNLLFIASDRRRVICYSQGCSKKNQRLKKQKQRSEHPEIYS